MGMFFGRACLTACSLTRTPGRVGSEEVRHGQTEENKSEQAQSDCSPDQSRCAARWLILSARWARLLPVISAKPIVTQAKARGTGMSAPW